MTYELPEPDNAGTDDNGYCVQGFSATQMQQAYTAGRGAMREEAVAVADRAANDYHDLANTQAENAADRISTELAKLP